MSIYREGPYGIEWPARLAKAGDKILCGRTDGRHWSCDGVIARYETEHGPVALGADGDYHVLPRVILGWGDTETEPGLHGPSRRALSRAGRPLRGQGVRGQDAAPHGPDGRDPIPQAMSGPQLPRHGGRR